MPENTIVFQLIYTSFYDFFVVEMNWRWYKKDFSSTW